MATKKTILIEFTQTGEGPNGVIDVRTTGWTPADPGIIIATEQLSMCDYMQNKIITSLVNYTCNLESMLNISETVQHN